MDILAELNPKQRQAVESSEGPVLVLAGPGSGKTRVLTQRIAYLVHQGGLNPYNVMAVTFTNKAAREMKERLHRLLGGERLRGLTIGTFHAICVRILHREAERAALNPDFVIFDSDDQLGLIRQALKELNLDDKMYRPRAVQATISRAKNELVLPETYPGHAPPSYRHEVIGRVYQRYQELLTANNAVDFDDILLFTVRLFDTQSDVLDRYQGRYVHVLVDEFQDTNMAQYELIKQLSGKHGNVFVVADEDQSIYSWRGADFRNIRRFQEDYQVRPILLERNYRSTQTILDVANAVITPNVQRTAKQLYTERGRGPLITLFEAYDEHEEGSFVVDEIQRLTAQGHVTPGDCAVMYRTNAQSRAVEDACMWRGLPYRLVGATRFYQRREIKDVIAYLRLTHNPYDSVSLARIINVPPRRIGDKTLATLASWANSLHIPLYTALQRLKEQTTASDAPLKSGPLKAVLNFLELLDEFMAASQKHNVLALLDLVLDRSGYQDYIQDGTEEGRERWDNVMELRTVAAEYSPLPAGVGLGAFLEQVALVSDVDNLDEEANALTLLTLHSAKGLEFPMVFIVGMNDGLLPHSRSFGDTDAMEEERRLCYVGITRARERLYLVHTFRRAWYGRGELSEPSRFLEDIPLHLIKGAEQGAEKAQPSEPQTIEHEPAPPGPPAESQFAVGDRVRHPMFGYGTVVESERVRGDEEVVVAFEEGGIKRLMVSFARLTKTDHE